VCVSDACKKILSIQNKQTKQDEMDHLG